MRNMNVFALGKRRQPRTLCRTWVAGAMLLCLLTSWRAIALDPQKSVEQFNCQSWTRQNGLPAHSINAVIQGQDGYIWLGTQNGLVRFDGHEFKLLPINLPGVVSQEIMSLSKATEGGIWFSCFNGGSGHYDGSTFSRIQNDKSARQDELKIILQARDGSIWVAARSGLSHLSKGRPAETLNPITLPTFLSLCEDRSGSLWLGTAEAGLFRCVNGTLSPLEDNGVKQHAVWAIAADHADQLWVGTDSGLRCYGTNGHLKTVLYDQEVKALLVDSHESLWIGTGRGGLVRYRDGDFCHLTKADGLCSDNITALCEDAEGSIWIGTREGLSQLSEVKLPIVSGKQGLIDGSIRSVAASQNGGFWGAAYGVTWFDGKRAKNITDASLLINPYIKTVFEDSHGNVYLVNGNKNIIVLSGTKRSALYQCEAWPLAFGEDTEGVLVAVGDGIFRIQEGKLKPYLYRNQQQPEFYWIKDLHVAKDGTLWVASHNGVFTIKDGAFKQWTTSNGLCGNVVECIREDEDGGMWLGLLNGMARIKDGLLKNVTQEHGLYDNRIFSVVPDDQGYFWVDSGHGIFRVSRRCLNDCADLKVARIECQPFNGLGSVKYFDRTDQENSGCKTADGRIWFPNHLGVVMIDPAHLFTNGVPPPVHIDKIRVNGREWKGPSASRLSIGERRVEFFFTVLTYIEPTKARVRYKLDGFDPGWVDAEGRRSVLYNNLHPGNYTFQVQACNADGVWNTVGDSFRMTLPPFFYETAWFRMFCGLVCIAAMFSTYRWKLRQMNIQQRKLQEQNELLDAKVSRRTEDLARSVSAMQNEIAERLHAEEKLKAALQEKERSLFLLKEAEAKNEATHKELLEVSRRAGMAEVARDVLHNVGNVLNSVNVSTNLIREKLRKSSVASLAKVRGLLQEHASDLTAFLGTDPKGKKVPMFIIHLSEVLEAERTAILAEHDSVVRNVEHIKEIVAMQQNCASVSGLLEQVSIAQLLDDALKTAELARHGIEIIRHYSDVPLLTVDKHEVLQILLNLVHNAKYALDGTSEQNKKLIVGIGMNGNDRVRVTVADRGIGIAPENLTRIFSQGFSTRKGGSGFGLHSGANAAKEMGGQLSANSDGLGKGATFTLVLPLIQDRSKW